MGERLGQHFLVDPSIIDQIIRWFDPQPGQHVVEIGPGRGAITGGLLAALGTLHAIELDPPLVAYLTQTYPSTLHVHHADVRTFDFRQLPSPLRVIGNLPYYLTTPLLFQLLAVSDHLQDLCFMVQEEVAVRLCAAPGDTAYGRLSVMAQYDCTMTYAFQVPPSAFAPPPAVQSAVIQLRPYRERPFVAQDRAQLQTLVATAFAQRRKMLRKSLQGIFQAADWAALEIDPEKRPQDLSVAQFVQMANFLSTRSATKKP